MKGTRTKTVDIFTPCVNIEKVDDLHKNISYFTLCYNVEYGVEKAQNENCK